MKHKFFSWVISLLTVFFVTGCAMNRENSFDYSSKAELDSVRKQVLLLAYNVGIPPSKAEKCSTKELLVDIEIRLNDDNHGYNGKFLTDNDIGVLSSYLNNKIQILQTIKGYHNYIRTMQHKKIIVLPESRP